MTGVDDFIPDRHFQPLEDESPATDLDAGNFGLSFESSSSLKSLEETGDAASASSSADKLANLSSFDNASAEASPVTTPRDPAIRRSVSFNVTDAPAVLGGAAEASSEQVGGGGGGGGCSADDGNGEDEDVDGGGGGRMCDDDVLPVSRSTYSAKQDDGELAAAARAIALKVQRANELCWGTSSPSHAAADEASGGGSGGDAGEGDGASAGCTSGGGGARDADSAEKGAGGDGGGGGGGGFALSALEMRLLAELDSLRLRLAHLERLAPATLAAAGATASAAAVPAATASLPAAPLPATAALTAAAAATTTATATAASPALPDGTAPAGAPARSDDGAAQRGPAPPPPPQPPPPPGSSGDRSPASLHPEGASPAALVTAEVWRGVPSRFVPLRAPPPIQVVVPGDLHFAPTGGSSTSSTSTSSTSSSTSSSNSSSSSSSSSLVGGSSRSVGGSPFSGSPFATPRGSPAPSPAASVANSPRRLPPADSADSASVHVSAHSGERDAQLALTGGGGGSSSSSSSSRSIGGGGGGGGAPGGHVGTAKYQPPLFVSPGAISSSLPGGSLPGGGSHPGLSPASLLSSAAPLRELSFSARLAKGQPLTKAWDDGALTALLRAHLRREQPSASVAPPLPPPLPPPQLGDKVSKASHLAGPGLPVYDKVADEDHAEDEAAARRRWVRRVKPKGPPSSASSTKATSSTRTGTSGSGSGGSSVETDIAGANDEDEDEPGALPPPDVVGLLHFLRADLLAPSKPPKVEESVSKGVDDFIMVPLSLERFILFGVFASLDMFLFVLTFLPLRVALSLGRFAAGWVAVPVVVASSAAWRGGRSAASPCGGGGGGAGGRGGGNGVGGEGGLAAAVRRAWERWPALKPAFHRAHGYDLLRVALFAVTLASLQCLDMSRVYHHIRGQAMIKLYVIIAMAEIFDRLLSSFGQDVLDSLYWTVRTSPRSLSLFHKATIALFYIVAHACLFFINVATLNVAINSADQALLSLLVSNNFAEIKTSVFKKFDANNLFQVASSDAIERFKLFIFMSLVLLLNLVQKADLDALTVWTSFGRQMGQVLLAEVIADWVKHAFITKFNALDPGLYTRFAMVLVKDVTEARSDASRPVLDHTHSLARRMGLAQLPLACIVVRFLQDVWARSSLRFGLGFRSQTRLLARAFGCLVLLKVLTGIVLAGLCAESRITEETAKAARRREQQRRQAELAAWVAEGLGCASASDAEVNHVVDFLNRKRVGDLAALAGLARGPGGTAFTASLVEHALPAKQAGWRQRIGELRDGPRGAGQALGGRGR